MQYPINKHRRDHATMGVTSGGGGGSPSNQYSSDILLSDTTQGAITELASRENRIRAAIGRLYDETPDAILTTTGAGDLQAAITALNDGQILEVAANGDYSPITIPAGKSFGVRVKSGYYPRLYQQARCIRVDDGASDVIISGLIIEEPTNAGGNNNYTGSAVAYSADNSKVGHIIFHNLTINGVVSGSAVVLSHHWSPYSEWTELADCSNDVAFVDCTINAGCADGTEGACILLRGFIDSAVVGCSINNAAQAGRGILVQAGTNLLIKDNRISDMAANGNSEGIKIDEIGTATYKNTAFIIGNMIKRCIEGIDVDDECDCYLQGNVVWDCADEAISLDNDSSLVAVGNVTHSSGSGIRFEAGSTGVLHSNLSFGNTNNYRMDNGYTPPADNSEDLNDWILPFKPGWDDLRMPSTQMKQGALFKPDFDYTDLGLLFPDGDPTEIAYSIAQHSHSYRIGSDVYPHVHFVQATAATPVFKLDYRWYNDGGDPTGAFTTITATAFAYAYAGSPIAQVAIFPKIAGSAITTLSSMMDCKIYRDDSDVGADVLVKEFDIHYYGDTFGSAGEFSK